MIIRSELRRRKYWAAVSRVNWERGLNEQIEAARRKRADEEAKRKREEKTVRIPQ
jgi:hypothetical protein